MLENLSISLIITAMGMGLVFGAILLLWGLMALLTRLFPEKPPAVEEAPLVPEPVGASAPPARNPRTAVAIAIALALAERDVLPPVGEFPLPPTAVVSPWQTVNRTTILTKRKLTR